MARRATISGVGMTAATSPSKQTSSVIELCQEAVWAAIDHARVSPRQLDAIVVGNIDGFEGTVLGGKHQTRVLGLGDQLPLTVINTGGTTGGNLMQVAARMVRSGAHERVLCLGGPTFFGAKDLQRAINTNSPMIVEQPLGMGAYHMGAFAASAYLERHGIDAAALGEIVAIDHRKGAANPLAHLRYEVTPDQVMEGMQLSTPLTLPMVCPVSTSACAVVVASEEAGSASGHPTALIKAMGTSSDPYLGGGKGDFAAMQNLAILARRVYALADVRSPRDEINVVELFAPYAHMQPMQLEALGFCEPGAGVDLMLSGATDRDGNLPTNMSGGPKCTNAGVAGELAPYAYIAMQLMGSAPPEIQLDDVRVGLAHGTGGSFFQFENLAVLHRIGD